MVYWHSTLQFQAAFLWILLLTRCLSSVSNDIGNDVSSGLSDIPNESDIGFQRLGKRSRVVFLIPSYPWCFGSHETQMYHLSVYLAKEHDIDVLWMPFNEHAALPKGEYKSFDDIKRRVPSIKSIPPPEDFGPLDHLTFVGFKFREEGGDIDPISATRLNRLAKDYRIDALVVLEDVVHIFPDVEFEFPALGWFPIHYSEKPITRADMDYWVLRNFHALAILSPSSLNSVQKGLADDSAAHTITATHVPHFINRLLLQKRSWKARQRLNLNKPLHKNYEDEGLKEIDAITTTTISNEKETERSRRRHDAEKILKSTMNDATETDTFLVLVQGVNDELDRKGLDHAIQAFALFHERVTQKLKQQSNTNDDTPPLLPVHLYLHSIESNVIDSDVLGGTYPQNAVPAKGKNLRFRLYYSGLPQDKYTLDGTIHEPEVVDVLKDLASVCLLPSRVEGFGLNLLECQALGTPVVTLNHTATGDFTRLGRAVKVRQKHFLKSLEFALPDVEYLSDALWELYLEHNALVHERKMLDAVNKSCKDNHEKCSIWELQGECQANPSYMLEHCQKSCNGCPKEAIDNVFKAEDVTTTIARNQELRDIMNWVDNNFSMEVVGQGMYSLLNAAVRNYQRRVEYKKLIKSVQTDIEYGDNVEIRNRDPDVQWIILSPPGVVFNPDALRHLGYSYYMNPEPSILFFGSEHGEQYDGKMLEKVIQEGIDCPNPIMIPTFFYTYLTKITTVKRSLVHSAFNKGLNQLRFGLKRIPENAILQHFVDES